VSQRLAGDPLAVQHVRLALEAPARPLRRPRWVDIADVVTLAAQVHRGVATQSARPLDPPPGDGPEAERPGLESPVAVARHLVMAGGNDASPLVDHSGRQRVPVGIHPDHVAPRVRSLHPLSPPRVRLSRGSADNSRLGARASDAPIQSDRSQSRRPGSTLQNKDTRSDEVENTKGSGPGSRLLPYRRSRLPGGPIEHREYEAGGGAASSPPRLTAKDPGGEEVPQGQARNPRPIPGCQLHPQGSCVSALAAFPRGRRPGQRGRPAGHPRLGRYASRRGGRRRGRGYGEPARALSVGLV
jgi:hypothetical protein